MRPFKPIQSVAPTEDDHPPRPGPADVVTDQSLRRLYGRLVGILGSLHTDVSVEESSVELRALFGEKPLCRVVPYRELIHMQIGSDPTWEVRVRDSGDFAEAVDRLLRVFLRLAAGARPRGARPAPRL
jgi:hypothetical protein